MGTIPNRHQQFKCGNCHNQVFVLDSMGTANRNHCPFCLFSKHLDELRGGDRRSRCFGLMQPLALTFKRERPDKYGKEKTGELMIIHHCLKCSKFSLNRLAADDYPDLVMQILYKSQKLPPDILQNMQAQSINPLTLKDEPKVKIQLFGVFMV